MCEMMTKMCVFCINRWENGKESIISWLFVLPLEAVSSGIRPVCRVAVCVLSSKETDKCDTLERTLSSNNYMNDGAITLYV